MVSTLPCPRRSAAEWEPPNGAKALAHGEVSRPARARRVRSISAVDKCCEACASAADMVGGLVPVSSSRAAVRAWRPFSPPYSATVSPCARWAAADLAAAGAAEASTRVVDRGTSSALARRARSTGST